ncbi:MAG TPA: putative porin [Chthoniobacteraceae bacterium]|nr:putative porin [Chthoniobacteraceae bacterium]
MNTKNLFFEERPRHPKLAVALTLIAWFAVGAIVYAADPAAPTDSAAPSAAAVATPAPSATPAPDAGQVPAPSSVAPSATPPTAAPATTPALRATAEPAPVVELPPAADNALFNPPADNAQAGKPAPSTNVTINLINRLVEKGVLSKDDASELIKQAEEDTVIARKQAIADAQQAAAAAAPEPPSSDDVRVTYVPEVVKQQLADQVKTEVMQQARDQKWAEPNAIPDWVSRFRFFGDIRVRYEGDFYPNGNDNTGAFPNFNAINTGAPFDTSPTNPLFPQEYNVDQNRNRFRLRARLGTEMDLGDGFTAGLRIATGNDDNPVTENQTLGGANSAQGGNFSKYSIWLDRAFIKYQVGDPDRGLTMTIGRFDNPFFSTPVIWADDIGFDGLALQGRYNVGGGFTPFVTAGGFPVFNTDFNFASNDPSKFQSQDKYLYAAQIGTDWKISKDWSAKIGAAFYDFENIEGKLSTPMVPLNSTDAGNTDDTRPSFAQNGNTYTPLRDIVPTAANDFGLIDQFQYYGLATPFREAALTGRIDYSHWDPFHVALTGEVVTNTAFERNAVTSKAVNNLGANGTYNGGPNAWIVNFKIGSAALEKKWDWNLGVNYRYVESDSVVDAFTDADFGAPLTGTNLKGYSLYGSMALSPRVWMYVRWMSADAIAGPPYRNDIIQLDINTKF